MKLDKYTVGKRYGKALFELAAEAGQTEPVYEDLLQLRRIYQEIPDLGNMLSDARLDQSAKSTLMGQLTSGFEGIVKNFLLVLHRYNRMADLLFVIDEYEKYYDQEKGLLFGSGDYGGSLGARTKATSEASVAKRLGFQAAQLEEKVDPSIVAGVVVQAQNWVIDGSVANQLAKIREQLK